MTNDLVVPDGMIFVCQFLDDWQQGTIFRYRVYSSGTTVPGKDVPDGVVLASGETKTVREDFFVGGSMRQRRTIVKNNNGVAELLDGDVEERKAFAFQVRTSLLEKGFSNSAVSRIIRAAGPGQAQEAVEWAEAARKTLKGEDRAVVDALDMVLSGLGGTNSFGKDRTIAALRVLGLPVPQVNTSNRLFGVLRGAKEVIATPRH